MEMQRQIEIMKHLAQEDTLISEAKDWQARAKAYYERYPIELMLIAVFTLSGLNWVLGRKLNQRHAEQWL